MQDRYAGDIGDYVKFALLRALSLGRRIGVAWYLYPDESHNDDGRHIGYLKQPAIWRHLDPELFDSLAKVQDQRAVAALESAGLLPEAVYFAEQAPGRETAPQFRSNARQKWFERAVAALEECNLVFADPDNGLIDNGDHRRRQSKFGKQMPLAEAHALSRGREAVIYHHNTRYPGGHDLEVKAWQQRLGQGTIAIRANAFSCRTFFILNPSEETIARASRFANQWSGHRVRFEGPL